jgi:hypothetical protein
MVEQFTASKSGRPERNEDAWVLASDFAAVVDGVSLKDETTGDGSSAPKVGRSAASMLVPALCRELTRLRRDIEGFEAIERLTEAVRSVCGAAGTLAASVIVYSEARHEVWSVGDCAYLAGDIRRQPRHAIDELMSGLRAFALDAEVAAGAEVHVLQRDDPGRRAIMPWLRKQQLFANMHADSPFAFGVIDGREVPHRLIHIWPVPDDVDELVLASDGYPVVEPTLAASEEALARLLAADPLCFRLYRTTKGLRPGDVSFDDRTYLRLRLDR